MAVSDIVDRGVRFLKTAWSRFSDPITGLVLCLLVGGVAGLGAVLFRWLISQFQFVFFNKGEQLLSFLGQYYIILIPAIGGLIIGPMIYFLAREAKGHGVPEVMEAVNVEGGRIRPVVALVKTIASSICIGSGGSVGREGPIVQIGASFGSTIAQLFRLSNERMQTLVACGAAGGIAATFNSPIAGALFALEIILRRVITPKFAYVILSAITADYVASFFLGNKRMFDIPQFQIVSPVEIVLYALLGIVAAFIAVAFIRSVYKCEDLFDAIKMPEYLKPAVGGIAIGLIGLYNVNLLGLGYTEIQRVLVAPVAVWLLLLFCILKIVATSITLGSGGSGGIFSPSLFIGAMLGTSLGGVFHNSLPIDIGPPGAYGTVGMAAVFGAATRAPLTAVIIVFEMTRDYTIILPLMAAVSISTTLSMILSRGTIYTTKLLRRGIDIEHVKLPENMRNITVSKAMVRRFTTVPESMPLKKLMSLFGKTGHHGFPVVDEKGLLTGIVTQTDLEWSLDMNESEVTVGDIATKSPFVAYPDEPLSKIFSSQERKHDLIPVVTRENRRRLVGILRPYDVIRAYRTKTGKVRRKR
jgi:CIC family chloride channel protein